MNWAEREIDNQLQRDAAPDWDEEEPTPDPPCRHCGAEDCFDGCPQARAHIEVQTARFNDLMASWRASKTTAFPNAAA